MVRMAAGGAGLVSRLQRQAERQGGRRRNQGREDIPPALRRLAPHLHDDDAGQVLGQRPRPHLRQGAVPKPQPLLDQRRAARRPDLPRTLRLARILESLGTPLYDDEIAPFAREVARIDVRAGRWRGSARAPRSSMCCPSGRPRIRNGCSTSPSEEERFSACHSIGNLALMDYAENVKITNSDFHLKLPVIKDQAKKYRTLAGVADKAAWTHGRNPRAGWPDDRFRLPGAQYSARGEALERMRQRCGGKSATAGAYNFSQIGDTACVNLIMLQKWP